MIYFVPLSFVGFLVSLGLLVGNLPLVGTIGFALMFVMMYGDLLEQRQMVLDNQKALRSRLDAGDPIGSVLRGEGDE